VGVPVSTVSLLFLYEKITLTPMELTHTIATVLYTSFFLGAIPILFTIISGIVIWRRHRMLAPIPLVMGFFQAACIVVLIRDYIPEMRSFVLLGIVLPAVLAVAGSLWAVLRTKTRREQAYGVGVSILGSALTGGHIAFYCTAVWQTI
jgi:hypothetical protein